MDDLASVDAALRAIQQPAFATSGNGFVLLHNKAFGTLLPTTASSGANVAWQTCLVGEGVLRWERGIGSGLPFSDRLHLSWASGRWKFEASPVLAGGAPDAPRWLVILTQETLEDPLDGQLARMSLHAAVRAGRMGLWEWDRRSGDSLWSPELYDVYRLPRGTGIEPGSRFLGIVHPDDIHRIDAAVACADTSGGIDPYVFRLHAGDGSVRWILTCAQAAREPGKPFSRLVGVNVDVTDTIQAEEQLEAARHERARHEQIMTAVMEHAPVGIAVTLSGEPELAYCSRFGAEMIKATPEVARTWAAWQIFHPETKAEARREDLPLFRAMAGAIVRNEEWLLRSQDGSLLPINCNAGPIRDADGAIIGGTVAWHDVTPFKEAQRRRELFIAAVSHELRTPLSAIHGWSAAMQRSRDPALIERGLLSIARNVDTQVRLVDDLLDAARIAAGRFSLSLGHDDLARIAGVAVESVLPIAEAAQVALNLTNADIALPVMVDEQRIRQAICNLLTNAVKFSRPGGLVTVVLRAKNGVAELDVIDQGIGMDAEHLHRAFDEFWQSAKAGERKGGLGLGLSIARHIVRGHGGSMESGSDGVGKGAIFTIRLPLR